MHLAELRQRLRDRVRSGALHLAENNERLRALTRVEDLQSPHICAVRADLNRLRVKLEATDQQIAADLMLDMDLLYALNALVNVRGVVNIPLPGVATSVGKSEVGFGRRGNPSLD